MCLAMDLHVASNAFQEGPNSKVTKGGQGKSKVKEGTLSYTCANVEMLRLQIPIFQFSPLERTEM